MSVAPVNTSQVRGTSQITQSTRGEGANAVRTIRTPDYEIAIEKGEVTIRNPKTGASVRAWGDPHLHTSDGDRMKFHTDNLTIDLPDGTKVTIVPTPVDAQGVSYIESVVVMNGSKAFVVGNLDPRNATAVPTERSYDSASAVRGLDRSIHDGTVLTVGRDVDDLRAVSKMNHVLGQLENDHEESLDGLGGASSNAYRAYDVDDSNELRSTLDELDRQAEELQDKITQAARNGDSNAMQEYQRKLSELRSVKDTLIAFDQAEIQAQQRRLQAFLEGIRNVV